MDFKEKAKNARAFIVLLAALIAELLNIKYNRELLDSMVILLVVIIIFFVIASIAIKLVDKIRNMDADNKENFEESTSDEEDEETGESQ